MENPVSDIPRVIQLLTQSPPSLQQSTIDKYFTPTASFTHPLVRTGSWDLGNGYNSRWAIERVYRWYKVMSPRIALTVDSVALDEATMTAYASVRQVFRIWFIPFYSASAELVVRLKLQEDKQARGRRTWRIASQEDNYQLTSLARFIPFAWGLWIAIWAFEFFALFGCIALAYIGYPVSYLEEQRQVGELTSEKGERKKTGRWEDAFQEQWTDAKAITKEIRKEGNPYEVLRTEARA